MYLKAYIYNLVKNGPVVSEESKFYFSYVNDLGPRARNDLDLEYQYTFIYSISCDLGPRVRNDLDLQYSYTFIKFNSISCLYLPTFRSQAAIVFEKSTVFTFSYRKAFDLAVK